MSQKCAGANAIIGVHQREPHIDKFVQCVCGGLQKMPHTNNLSANYYWSNTYSMTEKNKILQPTKTFGKTPNLDWFVPVLVIILLGSTDEQMVE